MGHLACHSCPSSGGVPSSAMLGLVGDCDGGCPTCSLLCLIFYSAQICSCSSLSAHHVMSLGPLGSLCHGPGVPKTPTAKEVPNLGSGRERGGGALQRHLKGVQRFVRETEI